ncbi:hypothetical protein PtA15_13A15 [Puccinia triticina]|uniref:Uncharacterized protein n=1 Tax=Puccinia triticina TaxID=208348 RepID=A0ABY7D2X6_9BASI|nr:uncharacterized protein PtA15_13A15 [Puccinia triticina]WAQ90617.1 hypothetical protein PtA15_13A15 [Puccinia triticina]
MRRAALTVPSTSFSQPIEVDSNYAEETPPATREPQAKRQRHPASQAVARTARLVRTPQVARGGQHNAPPNITPSRIIPDDPVRTHHIGQPNPPPNITPSRIIPDNPVGTHPPPVMSRQAAPHVGRGAPMAIVDPQFQPANFPPGRVPTITPTRVIASDDNHHQVGNPNVKLEDFDPPLPRSKDEDDPDDESSDEEGRTVYGSLDGFIRPPPPRKAQPQNTNLPKDRDFPTPPPAGRQPTPAPPRRAGLGAGDALVESLLASADLSDTDLQLARQLFVAQEETLWKLSVVMWLRQRPTHTPNNNPVIANGATAHVYGTVIRELMGIAWQTRVRQRIREILLEHTLESYSRLQSVHGLPFGQSPLPLAKQPAAFRRQNLPPGLPNNLESMASLVTFLRAMVKHERTHMRSLLLFNVRQETRVRELGPVPKLFDLVVQIDRQFKPRAALRTPEEIRAELHDGVRVRIAMLRIITIHHLVHRAPGDMRSQWDLIDNHLEAVREKPYLEMQAHAVLIIRRDRELFPGNIMFADVPIELVQIPSALETDIEARVMESELGPNPTHAQVDAILAREIALGN